MDVIVQMDRLFQLSTDWRVMSCSLPKILVSGDSQSPNKEEGLMKDISNSFERKPLIKKSQSYQIDSSKSQKNLSFGQFFLGLQANNDKQKMYQIISKLYHNEQEVSNLWNLNDTTIKTKHEQIKESLQQTQCEEREKKLNNRQKSLFNKQQEISMRLLKIQQGEKNLYEKQMEMLSRQQEVHNKEMAFQDQKIAIMQARYALIQEEEKLKELSFIYQRNLQTEKELNQLRMSLNQGWRELQIKQQQVYKIGNRIMKKQEQLNEFQRKLQIKSQQLKDNRKKMEERQTNLQNISVICKYLQVQQQKIKESQNMLKIKQQQLIKRENGFLELKKDLYYVLESLRKDFYENQERLNARQIEIFLILSAKEMKFSQNEESLEMQLHYTRLYIKSKQEKIKRALRDIEKYTEDIKEEKRIDDFLKDDVRMKLMKKIKKTRYVRKMEDEDTCAICIIDFQNKQLQVQLDCTHCYHPKCIFPWLNHQSKCPLCMTDQLK